MSDEREETLWRTQVIKPRLIDPLESAMADLRRMAGRDAHVDEALRKITQVREACDKEPLCHRPAVPESRKGKP